MASNFQFPYSKVIREDGEIIPGRDHNKQEDQLECLTDAVGNYNFSQGSIQSRLGTIESASNSLDDLDNVSVPSPNIGDVLTFSASGWVAASVAANLGDLTDVDTTGAVDGQALIFRSGSWGPESTSVTVASDSPGGSNEQIATEVTSMRFISRAGVGEDHVITEVSPGVIYIGAGAPPPVLSLISGLPSLVTGRLSNDPPAVNTTYPPSVSPGDVYSLITQSTSYQFDTDPSQFGSASLGTLILQINGTDVATLDLGANFVEGDRVAGQNIAANYNNTGSGDPMAAGVVTFTGGTLSILSVAPPGAVSIDEFQQGVARIDLAIAGIREGYNTVQLRHVTTGTSTSNTLEWFFDSDPAGGATDPVGSGQSIDEDTPVTKDLSGVTYYDTGSTFDLDFTLLRPFNNVYHQSDIPNIVDVSDLGDSTTGISITDPSVSGVSTPPDQGEIMVVTNFGVTTGGGVQSFQPDVDITPRDPYASYGTVSASNDFAIMSAGPDSTDTLERFTDERYRLPSSVDFNTPIAGTALPSPLNPGLWTSSSTLVGDTELQVYRPKLIPSNRLGWPEIDYSSSFLPQPNPDYSVEAGSASKLYRRVFRSGTGSQTNGIITLPGIADVDLDVGGTGTGIAIRLKVPGRTVWLNALIPFNGASFPTGAALSGGSDGEGCQINSGVHSPDIDGSIEFSLGTIGTDLSSDFQIIIEITYDNNGTTEILGTGSGLSISW